MSTQPTDLLGYIPEGAGEFDDTQERRPNRQMNIDAMTDIRKLERWMDITRNIPIEQIDAAMVNRTYPAAVWLFRAAAVSGDLKATKSLEMWLTWAKPIIAQNAQKERKVTASKGSVAFLPRVPVNSDEDEV